MCLIVFAMIVEVICHASMVLSVCFSVCAWVRVLVGACLSFCQSVYLIACGRVGACVRFCCHVGLNAGRHRSVSPHT